MSRPLVPRTLGGIAFLIAIYAIGCTPPKPPLAETTPVTVSVAYPIEKEVREYEEYLATLDAYKTVDVKARVTGYLLETKFKEGNEVKPEDGPIFRIDRRPFELDLRKAIADEKSAEAQVKLAKSEAARTEKGWRAGAIAKEDYDKAVAQVSVSEASIDVTKSSIDRAKLNLEYCEIKPPIKGIIGRELVSVGNLITADQTVLATIVTKDPIYAYFDIEEKVVQRYLKQTEGKRKGEASEGGNYPISLRLDDDEGFPHKGVVNFAETRASPNTGSMSLRGVFYRKDLSRELYPGFSARIRLPNVEQYKGILIPDRAVGTDQGQKFVFVVNSENKVEYRKVKLGFLFEELRVITDGLTLKDRVIINGLQRVRQGAPVEVQEVDLLTEKPIKETPSKK
jgi:multidrug efflux system membrane fusion protein